MAKVELQFHMSHAGLCPFFVEHHFHRLQFFTMTLPRSLIHNHTSNKILFLDVGMEKQQKQELGRRASVLPNGILVNKTFCKYFDWII